jgi:hypothetical protein
MTGPNDSATSAANRPAPPDGPCFACRGAGGIKSPCTVCGGTGRVSQPGPPWLSNWRRGGQVVEINSSVIATGLERQDEQVMLAEALGARDPAPKCYVCEGPDIAWLGDGPLVHYDMTGQCRDQHPHVVWEAAGPNIEEISALNLALGVSRPEDHRHGGGGAYVNPESYVGVISAPAPETGQTALVIAVALWTAGLSGQGTRAAMDWLASGRFRQMAAYCRHRVDRSGRPVSFDYGTRQLLDGPAMPLQNAVRNAWQCLAPVEEAIRLGVQAQPLDLRSWLTGSAVLAVSLPRKSSMAHRQVVIAMLMAAEAASHQDTMCVAGCRCAGKALPAPSVVWHYAGAPHPDGDGGKLAGRRSRWLVLAGGGAVFKNWTAHLSAGDTWQPIWLLGSQALGTVRDALTWRFFADVPALSAGQLLFVPDRTSPLVLDRYRPPGTHTTVTGNY